MDLLHIANICPVKCVNPCSSSCVFARRYISVTELGELQYLNRYETRVEIGLFHALFQINSCLLECWNIQRHILSDWRRGTAACPACWEMGANEVKQCTVYWADQSSQGRTKISYTGKTSPPNQPRKDPFHPQVFLKSPCASVSQSEGAMDSYLRVQSLWEQPLC